MMSTSTLLFLIASGQFLLSVQGVTLNLRLKGDPKQMIPDGGKVNITNLREGGCRRYESIECLSDVKYEGVFDREKAYWVYTDPNTLKEYVVDDIRCNLKGDKCKSPYIGWWSSRGIYRSRKDGQYYNVIRLSKRFKNARTGLFTCHFEGESNPVSVNIVPSVTPESDCGNFTTPNISENITNYNNNHILYTISWDAPCEVDSYTFYYTNPLEVRCYNETFYANMTSYTPESLNLLQIAAHRNEKTVKCSLIYQVVNGTLEERPDFKGNGCDCEEE